MLHSSSASFVTLPWLNMSDAGFASLGREFATPTAPTPLPAAHWVGCNDVLRAELNLPSDLWQQQDALEVLTGNRVPHGHPTYASVYSGHQFGQWAGQLGDGRALNLGAIQTPTGMQSCNSKVRGKRPTLAVAMAVPC